MKNNYMNKTLILTEKKKSKITKLTEIKILFNS